MSQGGTKQATTQNGRVTPPKQEEGESATVDLSKLTFREAIILEEVIGVPVDKLGDPDVEVSAAKQALALAYIVLRRRDSTITLEQVENMDLQETMASTLGGIEGPDLDPTPANG